jgi:hypothetical protein
VVLSEPWQIVSKPPAALLAGLIARAIPKAARKA